MQSLHLHSATGWKHYPTKKVNFIKRYLYATLGIFFVGLGAIGIWLPLIPTVGPLLLASFFFTKSFPALEERLVRHRFFARFHHYLDGSATMPVRARVVTIGVMWLSISISGFAFWASGRAPGWMFVLLVVSGLIGTVFIATFGRSNTARSKLEGSKTTTDENQHQE